MTEILLVLGMVGIPFGMLLVAEILIAKGY